MVYDEYRLVSTVIRHSLIERSRNDSLYEFARMEILDTPYRQLENATFSSLLHLIIRFTHLEILIWPLLINCCMRSTSFCIYINVHCRIQYDEVGFISSIEPNIQQKHLDTLTPHIHSSLTHIHNIHTFINHLFTSTIVLSEFRNCQRFRYCAEWESITV